MKECDLFNDKDQCTPALYCHKPGDPAWFCEPNPGLKVDCEVGTGCVTERCDPATGQCASVAWGDGKPCDDGSKCTQTDTCAAAKCTGNNPILCAGSNICTTNVCDAKTGLCTTSAKVCDDGNTCTNDACSLAAAATPTGGCVFVHNQASCDDGASCTTNDTCSGGKCAGKAAGCDDDEPCTTDGCAADTGACQHAVNTGACDDGDKCNGNDTCKAGKCAAGDGKVSCDDGNSCTADGCEKATGKCTSTPIQDGQACDDGSVCVNGELCSGGACKGLIKDCNDAKECTIDTCDPVKGCVNTALQDGAACGDAKSCAGAGVCSKNVCGAKQPRLWNKEFGSGPYSKIVDVAWLPIGRIVAVGSNAAEKDTDPEHWLLMLDDKGELLAEIKGQTTTADAERFHAVEPLGSDRAMVIGGHWVGPYERGLVVLFDKDGNELWRTQQMMSSTHRMLQVMDGGEVVVGGEEAIGKYPYAVVIRLDAKGKEQWRVQDSVAWSQTRAMVPHGVDGVMVISALSNLRLAVMAVDKAGKRSWRRILRVPTSFTINAAVARAGGGMMAVGSRYDPRGSAVWHLDSEGRLLSGSSLQLEKSAIATDIALAGANSYMVASLGLDPTHYGGSPTLARIDGDTNVRYVRGRKQNPSQNIRIAALPTGGWIMAGYRAYYPINLQSRAFIRRIDAWGNYACADVGKCDGLNHASCDDGNICVEFGCEADTGCTKTNSERACEDGSPCTFAGSCAFAKCEGTKTKLGPLKPADDPIETVDGVLGLSAGGIVTASTVRSAGAKRHAVMRLYEQGVVTQTLERKSASEDIDVFGSAIGEQRMFAAFGQQGGQALLWIASQPLVNFAAFTHKSATGTAALLGARRMSGTVYLVAGVESLAAGKSKALAARSGKHEFLWAKTYGDGSDRRAFRTFVNRSGTFIAVGQAGAAGAGKPAQLWLMGIDETNGNTKFEATLTTNPAAIEVRTALMLPDDTLIVGGAEIGGAGQAVLVRVDKNNNVVGTTALIPSGAKGPAVITSITRLFDGVLATAIETGTSERTRWLGRFDAQAKLLTTVGFNGVAGIDRRATSIGRTFDGQLVMGGADVDAKTGTSTPWLMRMDGKGGSACGP